MANSINEKIINDRILKALDEAIDLLIDLRDKKAEEFDNSEYNGFFSEDEFVNNLLVALFMPGRDKYKKSCDNSKPCGCKDECVYDLIDKNTKEDIWCDKCDNFHCEDEECYEIEDEDEIEDWINEPEKYIDITSPQTEEWEVLLGSVSDINSDNPIVSDDITINLSTATADARLTITGVPFKDIPLLHTLIDKVCNRAHEEAEDFEIQEEYIND